MSYTFEGCEVENGNMYSIIREDMVCVGIWQMAMVLSVVILNVGEVLQRVFFLYKMAPMGRFHG